VILVKLANPQLKIQAQTVCLPFMSMSFADKWHENCSGRSDLAGFAGALLAASLFLFNPRW
jgi:hypothetical protein